MLINRLLVLVAVVSVCSAGPIAINAVTASSTFFSYDLNRLTDGSGISGGLADNNYQNMWATNATNTGTLVFDLGAVFSLTNTLVWNYNADCCGLTRGVQNMTILLSTDDISYNAVGSFSPTIGTGGALPANDFNLGGATARYVKFDLTQNYGDSSFIGLSEVQIFGNAGEEVPEPASGALLLAGATTVVLLRRRRTLDRIC